MENSQTELPDLQTIKNELVKYLGGKVTLTISHETGVATICLDHQEKRNAISGKMMIEFSECVDALEKWPEGKAVIVCGKGRNFCSGGDLDFARAIGSPQGGTYMSTYMQDALNRLQKLPLISVCLIQGPTLGGGAEISVSCDFIVASDDVKYGFVHGRMGIVPAWGGAARLVKKVGRSRALDLLLTSKVLTADECLRLGLVEIVVPSEQALNKTKEWLASRIQQHHTVVRALKTMVLNTYYQSYENCLKLEIGTFAPFWGGPVNREALQRNLKHK